jgi:hypothetical protein
VGTCKHGSIPKLNVFFWQWVTLIGPLEKNHHIFYIPKTFWANDMGQIVVLF